MLPMTSMKSISPNKVGGALAAHRFQMLEDLAQELAGDVLFPTCFDVAARIRQTLNDPNVSLEKVAVVVRADPLISSKLLALANSAAYHSGQLPCREVKAAIERLGLNFVRTTGLAIAMRQ